MANMSMEEMSTFHRIEREMYVRLVFGLNRDPIQSMQVIAFWLWLDQMGFPNIIMRMASLPDSVINILVDEALICFDCLGYGFTPMASTSTNSHNNNNNIPMTENLLETTRFSLQFIRENRFQAFAGISGILTEVCIPLFSNIAQEASSHRNTASGSTGGSSNQNQVGNMMSPYPVPSLGHGAGLYRPLYQYQRPHFGFSTGASSSSGSQQPNVESSSGTSYGRLNLINQQQPPQPMWNPNENLINQQQPPQPMWNPNENVINQQQQPPIQPVQNANAIPPEDRSMFVTFSRGHPMRSWEITEFFNRVYGHCIEEIYMEEVEPNQQSMYARVVFISPMTIDLILNGQAKARFTINGRHVFVRRYISRRM